MVLRALFYGFTLENVRMNIFLNFSLGISNITDTVSALNWHLTEMY